MSAIVGAPGFTSWHCRVGGAACARCVYLWACECGCHQPKFVDASPSLGRVGQRGGTPTVPSPAVVVPPCTTLTDCPGCGRQLNAGEDRCPECTPRSAA